MKITVQSKFKKGEALFVFVPEKTKKPSIQWPQKNIETAAQNLLSQKNFALTHKQVVSLGMVDGTFVFLVGIKPKPTRIESLHVAGVAIAMGRKIKAASLHFLVPKSLKLEAVITGSVLANYRFKVGNTKDRFIPKKLEILSEEKIKTKEIKNIMSLAESVNLTRELINLPPNLMTPQILAKQAKDLAKGVTNPVKAKVLGETQMEKLGMGSLLSVGIGSHEESQLIVLEYKGGKSSEKPLALVGKAVCFDSGGYNLKPTGHIEEMKSDMSGGASILGVFHWLAKTKPKVNVVGVIGAVENLVNGRAFKPSDIITAMNGDTIEIINTDAEGRLVLADCLHYTITKFKPTKIVDLATLTGSCVAALGYEVSAIMGNDKSLLQAFSRATEKTEESVWELPITDHMRAKIKGENSDLINWTGGVGAGSSMGGAFLQHFVGDTPWIHLDIAGTAFHAKSSNPVTPKGATGVMVQSLAKWIEMSEI